MKIKETCCSGKYDPSHHTWAGNPNWRPPITGAHRSPPHPLRAPVDGAYLWARTERTAPVARWSWPTPTSDQLDMNPCRNPRVELWGSAGVWSVRMVRLQVRMRTRANVLVTLTLIWLNDHKETRTVQTSFVLRVFPILSCGIASSHYFVCWNKNLCISYQRHNDAFMTFISLLG